MDGHVCVPAVAVQPITAVEWDLADGQTLADTWGKGDARTPCLIYARFKGSIFLVVLALLTEFTYALEPINLTGISSLYRLPKVAGTAAA